MAFALSQVNSLQLADQYALQQTNFVAELASQAASNPARQDALVTVANAYSTISGQINSGVIKDLGTAISQLTAEDKALAVATGASSGMSSTSKVLLGGAVLAALWFFLKKKR